MTAPTPNAAPRGVKVIRVSRRAVRIGTATTFSAAGEELNYAAAPDATIVADAIPIGLLRWAWKIYPQGYPGRVLCVGTARTKEGAFVKATRAAQSPSVLRGGR